MARTLLHALRLAVRRFGIDISRYSPPQPTRLDVDIDSRAVATIERVQPYTMTSPSRLFALIEAVRYVVRTRVSGDIVECGVWRGGSMMAAALTLLECGDNTRELHMFDTYEGMTPPTAKDVAFDGRDAGTLLGAADRNDPLSVWCRAPLDGVRGALASTGYDVQRMHFIQGKVEDTVPRYAPGSIAVLRLDTDWYASTRHELEHLFPRLVRGGVLIVDDYGHWEGCRQAVDEYLEAGSLKLLLNRIDYTGRIAVKLD